MKLVGSAMVIAATLALAAPAVASASQEDLEAQIKALKEKNAALQKKIDALEHAKGARAQATTAPPEMKASATGPAKPIAYASIDPAGCRGPSASNAFEFECAGFSVYVGAMAMKRQQSGNAIIATPPTGTPGVLISGGDFNPKWDWGPEAILRYRFNNGWSVEGRYFNNRPDPATFNVPSVTTFRVAGIGVTILGGGALDSTYRSVLESTEFNVQKELVSGFAVLAGYRHFKFDDKLGIKIVGTGLNIGTWDNSTTLDGAQVGAKFSFWAPVLPIRVDTAAKFGAYRNSATNDFTSQIVSRAKDSQNATSYSAEASVGASYYFTPQLSLQATYTALWLTHVALADRAASTTIQGAGGTRSPVNFGSVWYNAASVRLGYDF